MESLKIVIIYHWQRTYSNISLLGIIGKNQNIYYLNLKYMVDMVGDIKPIKKAEF